ncbi:hypothetical protein Vadar_009848 [Vaccinium darrowii]|uniref:Uncharacterized protein n=1 Tax=Vaccinium darrowii TaxID=229202 RepID=A0ACB7XGW1_9ERIC|nr:hypothetical protein Vadar_009848 [Vaccinium darrowii]
MEEAMSLLVDGGRMGGVKSLLVGQAYGAGGGVAAVVELGLGVEEYWDVHESGFVEADFFGGAGVGRGGGMVASSAAGDVGSDAKDENHEEDESEGESCAVGEGDDALALWGLCDIGGRSPRVDALEVEKVATLRQHAEFVGFFIVAQAYGAGGGVTVVVELGFGVEEFWDVDKSGFTEADFLGGARGGGGCGGKLAGAAFGDVGRDANGVNMKKKNPRRSTAAIDTNNIMWYPLG